MYGKWPHSGSHSDVFICSYLQEDKVNIGLLLELVEITSFIPDAYSVHPSNNEFRRILALLSSNIDAVIIL